MYETKQKTKYKIKKGNAKIESLKLIEICKSLGSV